MTTSTGKQTARAAEIGREHREAYLAEFGGKPFRRLMHKPMATDGPTRSE